jgi:hypothetical protein
LISYSTSVHYLGKLGPFTAMHQLSSMLHAKFCPETCVLDI